MDYLIDWIAEHSIAIMAVLVMAIALLLFLLVFDKIRRWSRARRAARPPAWAVRPERPLNRADEPSTPVPTPSSRVCPYDLDVKSLHGTKAISVGPGGRLQARWVHAANEHAKTCPACKEWVLWLFKERASGNLEVRDLEQQFASAPGTDRT